MKKSISIILAVLMCFSCFSIISFAEEADSEHITTVPNGYVGVYTKDDLFAVRENPSGKYILMNDIVFDDADYENGGDFYNSGKGWEPIGTPSTPFRGIFDGNGYSIINILINTSLDFAGLFGDLSNATIKNLILCDANIIGENFTGGIAGRACYATTIRNCTISGYISGNGYVGGIVGEINSGHDAPEIHSYITNCINSAKIEGNDYIGGITGYCSDSSYPKLSNYGYTHIQYCANSGEIICSNNYAGGITGFLSALRANENNIVNCYNTGNVTANSYAGGIFGTDTYNSSRIKYSYSVGNVTAKSYFGGCFGNKPDYTIFCYYLDEAVSAPDYLYGTPKSTDQLRKKGTFEQWNFDTVWTMEGREDYPYPELRDVPLIFPDELNHEHEYSSEITTPATHLAEGVITYTCSCGDTYTEAIEKTTEHTYNTIVTAPTCTDRGFTLYYCACNDFYMADYVAANGHSHTAELTTPATHLTEGVMTYTCSCGDTYTEAIAKTTEHTYSAVVTPPTCTAQGYTTYTCVCGDTYVSDYVKENGHAHTATVTTPATHLTEGVMTYTCACGDTYTEVIAKTTTHTFTEEIITESTCTAKGKKLFTCECGYSYSEEIAKTSHVNANGDYACDICGNNICSHMCHQSGFMGFIWKIIKFFWKLFGMNPICECGAYHY